MFSPDTKKRLDELVSVFLEENTKLNLSALRTEKDCFTGNVLDSALGSEIIKDGSTIADIGTGGGFPLLPLSILLPNSKITGIDSTGKKITAIGRIIETMNIPNIKLVTGRLEELGHRQDLRESFDYVTSRALAPLPTLLEYSAPFVKVGGSIVCWKSINIEQELQDSIAARSELSCHLVKTHEYELPDDRGKRQILVFEKTMPLKKCYPRAIGIPKKTPIL